MTVSDLSPDALARLEAKLLADVEVIRKMRALLEEHGTALGTMAPAAAPAPPPAAPATPPAAPATPPAAVAAPATPAPPSKSMQELELEALATLGGKTFVMEDLRQAIHKTTRYYPQSGSLKVIVNRMIREGKVAVEERRTGRVGSVYRCLIPPSAEG